MSKDIRSFFTIKHSTGSKKETSIGTDKKINKRKRTALVISDSESDEEKEEIMNSKRNKHVSEKKTIPNKKNDDPKVSSKYFTCTNVDANSVFGSRVVKRNNSRNIIKKTEDKSEEFHIDKDFESELLKLDGFNTNTPSAKNESKSYECGDKTFNQCSDNNSSEENSNNFKQSKRTKLDSSCANNKVFDSKLSTSVKQNHGPLKNTSPIKIVCSKSMSKPVCTKTSHISDHPIVSQENHEKGPTNVCLTYSTETPKPKIEYIEPCKNKLSPPVINNTATNTSPSRENCLITEKQKEACCLWVDKYKPTTPKQIIGQQGEKSCVNRLIYWLRNWHKHNSDSKKPAKPSPWAKNDNGSFFKAALLSGPPGVGKTTTAHIVCKELGFDVVEFNASDTRSKKLLHQEVSELLSTNSLSPFFAGNESQSGLTKHHALLMDEVDGMAGNEDRGGVQELITLIKQSKVPIICMCNDRNHPKIRSLANYCFDLRFFKPRVEQIRGAMMSICFKENLKIKPYALTDIITSANQDIRLIINHLSMLAIENTTLAKSTKHVKLGPWDIVRKIFSEEEHKGLSIHDKCDLFFHDYSVTPLFVQENYLNAIPHKLSGKNKIKKMQKFAAAAKSLSVGDLTERSIRSHNAWGLLPVQAIFSSYVPGEILEGHLGGQINFPAWFGKNSRQTKMHRLLQDLTIHSRLKISGNKEAMNLDYTTPLEESILSPLVRLGVDGISHSLAVLAEYCLVRDDLESLSELSTWPGSKNRFSEVESKVKSAFTRAYNKSAAPTPYAAVPVRKPSKAGVTDSLTGEEDEDNILYEGGDEKEDDLEVDAMIIQRKPQVPKQELGAKPPKPTSKGNKNSKRGRKN